MCMVEDAVRPAAEVGGVSLLIDSEPPHRNVVHEFRSCRIIVAPGDVIASACRQHLDLRVLRKMLGDVASVQLGAAVDLGAIALHHDSELHCAEGSGSSPESSL